MQKRLSKLMDANLRPYFITLVLFSLATIAFEPILAIVEAVVILLLFIFSRNQSRQRRRSMTAYLDTITGGADAVRGSNAMPVVVFRSDNGEIIWANEGFLALHENSEELFTMTIGDLAPDFRYDAILRGEDQAGEVTELGGRSYQVYGAASRVTGRAHTDLVTAYFVDITEREHLRAVYDATRLVVSILVLDNYDEIIMPAVRHPSPPCWRRWMSS